MVVASVKEDNVREDNVREDNARVKDSVREDSVRAPQNLAATEEPGITRAQIRVVVIIAPATIVTVRSAATTVIAAATIVTTTTAVATIATAIAAAGKIEGTMNGKATNQRVNKQMLHLHQVKAKARRNKKVGDLFLSDSVLRS